MPPDPDPLAAELAGIRDRAAQITGDHDPADCIGDLGGPCSGHDAERLADVVEAVLALVGEAYVMSATYEYGTGRRDSASCDLDPVAIRAAITSKLLSEERRDAAWD
jgi:hypothetical protein